MKRFLSFVLAFVMVFTTVIQALPPLEVKAAKPTGGAILPTEIYDGDEFIFSGVTNANGSKIDIVNIGMYKDSTMAEGITYFRQEDINQNQYDFEDEVPSFTWGDTLETVNENSTNPPLKTNKLDSCYFVIITKAKDGTYLEQKFTAYYQGELQEPEINSHEDGAVIACNQDVRFSWSSVHGADEYEYELYDVTSNNDIISDYTTKRYITIDSNEFESGHEYQFYVRALRDAGAESDWGSVKILIEKSNIHPIVNDFEISNDELAKNGSIGLNGTISGNGETIQVVQVSIFNEDGSLGGKYYRVEDVNSETFDLSTVPAITMSATAGSNNMKLEVGKSYKIVVFATLENANGFSSNPTASFDVLETYASVDGFAISNNSLTEDGSISLSGTINGNGETIKTVQVNIFNEDGSLGGKYYRVEDVNAENFDLSTVPAITMEATAGSANMKLEAGQSYKVVVFVTLENTKGFTSNPTET